MRLLILTQSVDTADPVLGFFHRWVEAFAGDFDQIEIVCLKEGAHHLPKNVRVHSLGKEGGRSRLKYILNFYRYLFSLRYDAIFVHMNQEYVLLGGIPWRLMGKRIYLWRNYHAGGFFTAMAVLFSHKVFCTSAHSYTAKFKKAVLMPVGVDTERFYPDQHVALKPRSILFLSGMWPSKRAEILVDALALLHKESIAFTANLYGSPLPESQIYYEGVLQRADEADLGGFVTFHSGVPNERTPDIYRAHELFVNCSPSGMFDKTLFEAAASGCLVIAQSEDWAALAGGVLSFDGSAQGLADALQTLLKLPENEKASLRERCAMLAQAQSLKSLAERLSHAIY